MRDLVAAFKALGDETRLQMMALLLRHGELCVCDLEHVLGVTQSKSSRHLKTLRHAGLVDHRRQAVWMHYRVADDLGAARAIVVDAVRRLLDAGAMTDLDQRLAEWRTAKERGTLCAGERP